MLIGQAHDELLKLTFFNRPTELFCRLFVQPLEFSWKTQSP